MRFCSANQMPLTASDSAAGGGGTHPRCAVVLVAGMGTRLASRTSDVPKCLVEVNGVSILLNALNQLATANVRETVLVVGYRRDQIARTIGTSVGPMRIAYRENCGYEATNTSQSLWIGLEGIDDDVLVLEGDIFFERRVITEFLAAPHVDATLVERWNPTLDGTVVEVGADRLVRRWVHKKDRPSNFTLEGTYKTVNVHRFSAPFLRDHLRPVLAGEVARGGREPMETVLAAAVANGARVHAVDVRGRWVEIDTSGDLELAEAAFRDAADESR